MISEETLAIWGKHLLEKVSNAESPEMQRYKTFLGELKARTERKEDAIIAVCGPRGYGKSSFGVVSALILRQLMGADKFNFENICYHYDTIGDLVEKASHDTTKVYVIDEAVDVAFSRNAMGKLNKELAKFMIKARKRRNIYFWCIPSFLELDSVHRNDTVHFWVEIFYKTKHEDESKRYALAAIFRKDLNPFNRDKWGFEDAKKLVKRSVHNPHEQLELMRRVKSYVCTLAFPALPKAVESVYEESSFEALAQTGVDFKAAFARKTPAQVVPGANMELK